MGEAKRRRADTAKLVWHHTSILRTNRIWMTGVIDLEGRSTGVEHPALGPIYTSPTARRALIDFPAVAWFTSDVSVPHCLERFDVIGMDRVTGQPKTMELDRDTAAGFAMNRVALGFPKASSGFVPWPDYYGYDTDEGRALNESAREVSDDPDLWWISEAPVDVLQATELRISPYLLKAKLERNDAYLEEVRKMVRLCRAVPSTVIPPTWVGSAAHKALIASGGSTGKWDHLAPAASGFR